MSVCESVLGVSAWLTVSMTAYLFSCVFVYEMRVYGLLSVSNYFLLLVTN